MIDARQSILKFAATRDSGYAITNWPWSEAPLPDADELALLADLEAWMGAAAPLVALKDPQHVRAAWAASTFAVRMGIHGVRTGSTLAARTGAVGLVADDGLVDVRDALTRVALVAECFDRLGLSVDEEFERLIAVGPQKKGTIQGYLRREAVMRKCQVFGWRSMGEGAEFRLVPK